MLAADTPARSASIQSRFLHPSMHIILKEGTHQ
uniref:Uncharacterized protein n=1 Tax=Anguilla anguilla TaxID=7936 RepID=A0A0E9VN77_ANGAN